jgi:hypothetical protein
MTCLNYKWCTFWYIKLNQLVQLIVVLTTLDIYRFYLSELNFILIRKFYPNDSKPT